MAHKKLREQSLLKLKPKEFTDVNDCLQLERNAVIGVSLLPLISILSYKNSDHAHEYQALLFLPVRKHEDQQ